MPIDGISEGWEEYRDRLVEKSERVAKKEQWVNECLLVLHTLRGSLKEKSKVSQIDHLLQSWSEITEC